jgi:Tfp pilus assembly protein PilO
MRILTPYRFRLFFLTLLAGIAVASVAYNFHLRQRVDALESENVKWKQEEQERKDKERRQEESRIEVSKEILDAMKEQKEMLKQIFEEQRKSGEKWKSLGN